MKVILEIEDTTSPTGGDIDAAVELLNQLAPMIGVGMYQLDPDGHEWVAVGASKPFDVTTGPFLRKDVKHR